MSAPQLVRVIKSERFVDMAGVEHLTHAEAHRASIAGLLASFLADQGVRGPESVAWALLGQFTVVPRLELNKD